MRIFLKRYGFFIFLCLLIPILGHTQFSIGIGGGGGFGGGALSAKLSGLRDALIGTILPLVSTIGLVYASILAISGSGEGRGKVIGVVVMSIIGFMARYIIEFFRSIAA